jgi:hypothetical protein
MSACGVGPSASQGGGGPPRSSCFSRRVSVALASRWASRACCCAAISKRGARRITGRRLTRDPLHVRFCEAAPQVKQHPLWSFSSRSSSPPCSVPCAVAGADVASEVRHRSVRAQRDGDPVDRRRIGGAEGAGRPLSNGSPRQPSPHPRAPHPGLFARWTAPRLTPLGRALRRRSWWTTDAAHAWGLVPSALTPERVARAREATREGTRCDMLAAAPNRCALRTTATVSPSDGATNHLFVLNSRAVNRPNGTRRAANVRDEFSGGTVPELDGTKLWHQAAGSKLTTSAPRVIRTPDLLIRSQTLYPTELWARE